MSNNTEAVAQSLIALLNAAQNVRAIETLYADTVQTIEADPSRTRQGKAVVQQSMADFAATHDFAYTVIEGPLVSGDSFALRLRFDATPKVGETTFTVDELGVYTVADGKIVREQFFYPTG